MRKFFIGITMLLSINSVHAGDQGFIDFVVKTAHGRNFTQCDNSIKKVFENVGGTDIRVNSELFDKTASDALRLTSTFGSNGDSVYPVSYTHLRRRRWPALYSPSRIR